MAKEFWIQKALNPEKKGALRKALKAKKGKKISAGKLEKATHSKNKTLRSRANFAERMREIQAKRKKAS